MHIPFILSFHKHDKILYSRRLAIVNRQRDLPLTFYLLGFQILYLRHNSTDFKCNLDLGLVLQSFLESKFLLLLSIHFFVMICLPKDFRV